MSVGEIRIIGDPVLRQQARPVEDLDAALVRLAEEMVETMYAAPGIGLAAPQVGVQQRFFVFDMGDGPQTLVNPVIEETDGEWYFDEGCLSVPGLYFEICRPKTISVRGIDLDGNEVGFEADELLARLVQHEMDHLDGVLLIDHLEPEQRKEAKREIRRLVMGERGPDAAPERSRRLLRR